MIEIPHKSALSVIIDTLSSVNYILSYITLLSYTILLYFTQLC